MKSNLFSSKPTNALKNGNHCHENRMSFSPFSVRNYDEGLITGTRVIVQYQQQEHTGHVVQSMPELNMFCVEIDSPHHRGGHIMVTRGIEELKIHSDKQLEDEIYMEEVYDCNNTSLSVDVNKIDDCSAETGQDNDAGSLIDVVDTCDISQDMDIEYTSCHKNTKTCTDIKKSHQEVALSRTNNSNGSQESDLRRHHLIVNSPPNCQDESPSSGYITRTGSHLTSLSPPISGSLPRDSYADVDANEEEEEDFGYDESLAGSDSHPLTNSTNSTGRTISSATFDRRDYGLFSAVHQALSSSLSQSFPYAGGLSISSNISSPSTDISCSGPSETASGQATCMLFICTLCPYRSPQEEKMVHHLLDSHIKQMSSVVTSATEELTKDSRENDAPDANSVPGNSLELLSRFYHQHEITVERLTEMFAAELITNRESSNQRLVLQPVEQNDCKSIASTEHHPELHDNLAPLGLIQGRSSSSSVSLSTSGNRLRRLSENQLDYNEEISQSSITQSSPIKIPGRQANDLEHDAPVKKARILSMSNCQDYPQPNSHIFPSLPSQFLSNSQNSCGQMTRCLPTTPIGCRLGGIDRSKSTSWLPGLAGVSRLSAASPVSISPIGNSVSVFQISATSPFSALAAAHLAPTRHSACTPFSLGRSKPAARSDWLQPDFTGLCNNGSMFSSPQSLSPSHVTPHTSYPGSFVSLNHPSSCSAASNYAVSQNSQTSSNARRVRSDVKKCRKVYGVDQRDRWCNQCKWKKACRRFPDPEPLS